MHLFYDPFIQGDNIELDEKESKHAVRVLRLVKGDRVILVDGRGGWYEAVIEEDHPKRCRLQIESKTEQFGSLPYELHLAVAAREALAAEGLAINVVSAPCLELFEEQGIDYRKELFPDGLPVATVEAGVTEPWRGLAGEGGLTIGVDRCGASAPAAVLAERYGITAEGVTGRLRDWLKGLQQG